MKKVVMLDLDDFNALQCLVHDIKIDLENIEDSYFKSVVECKLIEIENILNKEKIMQNKLKFPTFEYIKSLPLTDGKDRYGEDVIKEYYFTLFEVYGSIYCRFTYNEDGNEKFYLDLMQNGYSDQCSFRPHKDIYKCNESDYKLLCEHAQMLYDEILGKLLNSNREYSERWIKDNE